MNEQKKEEWMESSFYEGHAIVIYHYQTIHLRAKQNEIWIFWLYFAILGLWSPLIGSIWGPKPSHLFKLCFPALGDSIWIGNLAFHYHRGKKTIENTKILVISYYFKLVGAPGSTPSGISFLVFCTPPLDDSKST